MAVPAVLIVDDDPAVRGLLRAITERGGVTVHEAAGGIECLHLLALHEYEVVVIDIAMEAANSAELLESMRRLPNPPAVIVFTPLTRWSFIGMDNPVVVSVLAKPFDPDVAAPVIVSTAAAMHRRRAGRVALRLRPEKRAIV